MTAGPEPSVLLVDLAKRFGGAEVRVLSLAESLAGKAQCRVAALEGSPLHLRLEAGGLPVVPIPYGRGDPRVVGLLRRAIQSQAANIVDAHNAQSQLWGIKAAVREGVPNRVVTVHSVYRREHPGSLRGPAYEGVLRLDARWGCRFVAVSREVGDHVGRLVGNRAEVDVVRAGFPPPLQQSGTADLQRSAFGWSQDDYVVVILARLERTKGHATLLDSLALARQKRPELRCLIAGSGPEREALQRQTTRLDLGDTVRFAGFVEDVPAVLRLADAFCLPSETEGLPYAVLEAAAFRLPLVVTSVGGLGELLTHDRDAWLLSPGDVSGLAEALETLAARPDTGRRLAEGAYATLSSELAHDRMVSETLRVYGHPTRLES